MHSTPERIPHTHVMALLAKQMCIPLPVHGSCRTDAETSSLRAELAARAAALEEARSAADAANSEVAALRARASSLQVKQHMTACQQYFQLGVVAMMHRRIDHTPDAALLRRRRRCGCSTRHCDQSGNYHVSGP